VDGYSVTVFELKGGDPLAAALTEVGHAPDYAAAVRAAARAVTEAQGEAGN
jgi:hypothetical protein